MKTMFEKTERHIVYTLVFTKRLFTIGIVWDFKDEKFYLTPTLVYNPVVKKYDALIRPQALSIEWGFWGIFVGSSTYILNKEAILNPFKENKE